MWRNDWQRRLYACGICVVASAILGGCGDDLYDVHEVASFSEGASFYIGDDALIPYSLIKDKMKPEFAQGAKSSDGKVQSAGDAAYTKILPTTGYYEQQVIRALSAALAINLPTTTVKYDTEAKTDADGKTQVTVNNSTNYQTGSVPTPEQVKAGQAGMPANAMSSIEPLKTNDKERSLDGVNPILGYNLASALVQEIALLNQALDYIESESSATHQTYVLRFRVRVTPVAPNQPYNSVVSVGFFCTLEGNTEPSSFGRVKVHPLLVADDLSTTATSRSAQIITQLSLAVSGMLGPAGIGGIFNSNTSKIRSLLGKDIDSTFSVARSSDNTIVAKLGAPRQPTAGYAMIDRSYAISVVLQVPNDCPSVNISAAASLRNANTGKLVPASPQPIRQGLRAAFRSHLETQASDQQSVDRAMQFITDRDVMELASYTRPANEQKFYANFRQLVARVLQVAPTIAPDGNVDYFTKRVVETWPALWVSITRELAKSPFQNVSTSIVVKAGPISQQPSGVRIGRITTPQDPSHRSRSSSPAQQRPSPAPQLPSPSWERPPTRIQ